MPITYGESRFSDEELSVKYKAMELAPFQVIKVGSCNFRPHPFTIGPRHVAHASDHCGGRLGDDTIFKIGCAATGCGQPASSHSFDVVLFLKLTSNTDNATVNRVLKSICPAMEADGIDGVALVETDEKFRVSS